MKDYRLRRTVGSLLILLCLALAEPASAQTTTATISGTVSDETKALLAGVSISVKNLDTGMIRVATTDSEGRYRVALLSPAHYEVQAAANGFQTAIRTGLELTIGRQATRAEEARPTFVALRELRDRLRSANPSLGTALSMGMTDDFEVAVEEGATIVRVGRALFGERPQPGA